ncbi:MAG TPA: iron ABC transporter permease [Abditibacterium sp.]|jgi:iron(III) transport system permease protein
MAVSYPQYPAVPRPKWSWRAHSTSILTWFFCALFFGPFLIYPVFQVLVGALSTLDRATGIRTFTPSLLLLPLQNPLVRESLVNSFWLGVLATILASVIAIPLAYAAARLKFWGKSFLTGLLLVPLLLPPLVGAVGLKQMLAREGFINTLLGRNQNPIDFLGSTSLNGWGPLLMVVLVSALHLYPLIYLNVSAAWANIDSSLEEAAENQGASAWRVFFTVTLPLLLPGYLSGALIVFIFAFTDLGTPLIFGFKRVAAVQIFDARTTQDPAGYAVALYLVILSGLIFWISRKYLDGGKIATLARGTRRARESSPSKWVQPFLYLYFLGVIFVALLPHFGVILASFASDWTSRLWPVWTTDNYVQVFTNPNIPAANAIKISLLCAAASMILDVIGGFFLAYALVRGKVWAKGFLDTLAMLPLALPGLILAFGLLISYRGTFLDPFNNPIPLLIISYAVRRLPYALRSVSAGLQQMSVALEEASQNMGATPIQTMWQVTRPLVTANLIAAGLLTFAFAVLEVSDSLVLAANPEIIPIAQAIFRMVQSAKLFPACALGVVGMLLLTATFMLVNKLLGKQLGSLFRV